MADTLAQLITKVQNILGDASGTYFTTAIVTAGIRQALSEWNMRAPVHAAITITAAADQYEYELTDEDPNSCEIMDVLERGDNNNELDISVDYDQYIEDERVFFRLRRPVDAGGIIIVRYTIYHTINGLDSQVESTLLARDDQAMVDGAAYYSLMIRATARVETINLSQDQSDNYREIASMYQALFNTRLAKAARYRKAAVGEPDERAWEDSYHTWEQ